MQDAFRNAAEDALYPPESAVKNKSSSRTWQLPRPSSSSSSSYSSNHRRQLLHTCHLASREYSTKSDHQFIVCCEVGPDLLEDAEDADGGSSFRRIRPRPNPNPGPSGSGREQEASRGFTDDEEYEAMRPCPGRVVANRQWRTDPRRGRDPYWCVRL